MANLTIRDVMDAETHAVRADTPIFDAISILIDRGVTGVPVVDEQGRALGILSEEHCLELVAKGDSRANPPTGPVGAFYDPTVQGVSPDMDVYFAAGLFLRGHHRRFPVVEGGKLVGVVTRKDLLRTLRTQLDKQRAEPGQAVPGDGPARSESARFQKREERAGSPPAGSR